MKCYKTVVNDDTLLNIPSSASLRHEVRERCGELEDKNRRLRFALVEATVDIRHWLGLARRQREMMNQDLGWCPTEAGIRGSENLLEEIARILRETQ